MRLRNLLTTVLLAGFTAAGLPIAGNDVLKHLEEMLAWYRDASAVEQSPAGPRESLFRDTLRKASSQALHSAFDFARAQAALGGKGQVETAPAEGRTRNLAQAGATAEQRVQDLQAQIEQANRELQAAPARLETALRAKRDKLTAELNLAKARRDSLRTLLGFLAGSENGGIAGKINDLERSVPDTAASAPAAEATQDFHPESAGIVGLTTYVFAVSRKMSRLKALGEESEQLRHSAEAMRAPLRTALMDIIHRSDALASMPDDAATADLSAARKELDTLLGQFKQVSGMSAPLAQEVAGLNAVHSDVLQWRSALSQQNGTALRYLVVRLSMLVLGIGVLLLLSALWRRGTIRYVQDVRRRRQLLLLRRIVVGCTIAVFVLLSFVTEFGSIATFAGFSAAGIALAMQSVILSVVAYFFLVGRWGVRVGDRITVCGITGDVIEIGLFRVYLMELAKNGPDTHATGRVVVFPNAVFFQPSALYKQFPGIDYTWRTVSFTVTPYGDYATLEKHLISAVESVYEEYRENIEKQHQAAQSTENLHTPIPRPESRLRLVDGGLEFAVRYPVEIRRAGEIDTRITRELLAVIDRHPTVVFAATPKVQAAG